MLAAGLVAAGAGEAPPLEDIGRIDPVPYPALVEQAAAVGRVLADGDGGRITTGDRHREAGLRVSQERETGSGWRGYRAAPAPAREARTPGPANRGPAFPARYAVSRGDRQRNACSVH